MGRVLIIDDDPQYAEMLMQHALASDHEVTCCGTLKEGLAAVSTFAPEVTLLDVVLPDGNGLGRLRDIKEARCCPEIIVITGAGAGVGRARIIDGGVIAPAAPEKTVNA